MILDTDVWSRLARRHPDDEKMRTTFETHLRRGHNVFFSAIVVYELSQWLLDLERSPKHCAYTRCLMQLRFRIPVLDFTESDAEQAGRFAALLRVLGQDVGIGDCLIAGQAAARGLPLVTFNQRHYRRFIALDTTALDLRDPSTFDTMDLDL